MSIHNIQNAFHICFTYKSLVSLSFESEERIIIVLPLIYFKRLLFVANLVDLCRHSLYMFLKTMKYISLGNPWPTRKFQLLPCFEDVTHGKLYSSSALRAQDVNVGIDPMWGGYHLSQLPWPESILVGFTEWWTILNMYTCNTI